MSESITFLLQTIGIGLLVGFLFGYLFKKVSKLILLLAALAVVIIVLLGHNDILGIDWLSVKEESFAFFEKYFEEHSPRLRLLLQNIPFAIGLVIGGIIGLRKG